jgi:hypothetical protein
LEAVADEPTDIEKADTSTGEWREYFQAQVEQRLQLGGLLLKALRDSLSNPRHNPFIVEAVAESTGTNIGDVHSAWVALYASGAVVQREGMSVPAEPLPAYIQPYVPS